MFTVGPPVSGADFIGREKEIKELMRAITECRNISIYGLPRIGKTSLVKETIRRFNMNESAYTPLFFEFALTRKPGDIKIFYSRLFRFLKEQLRKTDQLSVIEDNDALKNYSSEIGNSISYADIIDVYTELYNSTNRILYIVIDEMDYAHESLKDEIQNLRELGSQSGIIRLINISRHSLTTIFPIGNDGSNYPGIFSKFIVIKGYSSEDVALFKTVFAREFGEEISSAVWEKICYYCGNIPILLATFASRILEQRNDYPNIDLETLTTTHSPYYMCLYYWFQSLCERRIIKELRAFIQSKQNASKELVSLGLIENNKLSIPFLEEYLASFSEKNNAELISQYYSLVDDIKMLVERASALIMNLQGTDVTTYKRFQHYITNMKIILLKCNYIKEYHTLNMNLLENQDVIVSLDISIDEIYRFKDYTNVVGQEVDSLMS